MGSNSKPINVLITGGAGFIGGCMIRRLIREENINIYNLDKCGYASDLETIKKYHKSENYNFLQIDLANKEEVENAVMFSDPDLILHFAAESHVDRSIDNPEIFISSNIIGTFNLLEAARFHWDRISSERKESFRFHHISTDEVFGSIEGNEYFNETSNYDPRSPYSASKASSDHLVMSWNHTFNLPTIITNCSNNFGPWQFPEKLIPLVILKAINQEEIPLYGDGQNIRDWLYVEDHIDAILLAANKGKCGHKYCIGGNSEKSNLQVVEKICCFLDERFPSKSPHNRLISLVKDRPGHDRRYAIDSSKIKNELGWFPSHTFEEALLLTFNWYLKNPKWCKNIMRSSNYYGSRIGFNKNEL